MGLPLFEVRAQCFFHEQIDPVSSRRVSKKLSRTVFFAFVPMVSRKCGSDHAPPRLNAGSIHHQRERRQHFGNATAIEGRTHMDNVRRVQTVGFPKNPFHGLGPDQGRILFN